MVADGLGFALDEITETIEPVIAKETVKTEFLEVAPGQVAGVHQIARGIWEGEDKIFMELQMYVGAKHPADTVELRGEPNLTLTIPGGTHGDIATAAVAVNAIRRFSPPPPACARSATSRWVSCRQTPHRSHDLQWRRM